MNAPCAGCGLQQPAHACFVEASRRTRTMPHAGMHFEPRPPLGRMQFHTAKDRTSMRKLSLIASAVVLIALSFHAAPAQAQPGAPSMRELQAMIDSSQMIDPEIEKFL